MNAKKVLPFAVVALAGLWVAVKAAPPSPTAGQMDLHAFGQIPVQFQGRHMPLDTVARHHLLVMSFGKQEVVIGEPGSKSARNAPAIRWYLDLVAGKKEWSDYKFIRVDSPEVRQFLSLPKRPGWWRYSAAEISERLELKDTDVRKVVVKARNEQPLSEFEKALLSTRSHVMTAIGLKQLALPGLIPNPDEPSLWLSPQEVDQRNAHPFMEEARRLGAQDLNQRLREQPELLEGLKKQLSPEQIEIALERARDAAAEPRLQELLDQNRKSYSPQSAAFHDIIRAYAQDRPEEFNAAVEAYQATYAAAQATDDTRYVSLEHFFNRFEPFFICQWLYVGVMVLAALSWVMWGPPLVRTATYLALFTFALHTTALVMRVVISGKPPVTNLYSTAVFIGWGSVALCIAMEFYYRNGLPVSIGGAIGMATMLVAKFLEGNGDTMPRVEAVLNTNFWLASHVTIVSLGYSATFVAGFFAIAYIFLGFFTPVLNNDVRRLPVTGLLGFVTRVLFKGEPGGRALYGMMYGVTCFATLLSFVGTVLGGFWADDSWGRFWGWDPKENGAVLIVMWNALNLHLRWAGLVKARGFALMAVLGNCVVTWSWFGTNQLGIGLHAYGFDSNLAEGVAICWIIHLLIAALGLVPLKFWSSFGESTKA